MASFSYLNQCLLIAYVLVNYLRVHLSLRYWVGLEFLFSLIVGMSILHGD